MKVIINPQNLRDGLLKSATPSSRLSDSEEGEEWKTSPCEEVLEGYLYLRETSLPDPFQDISGFFSREGEFYNGEISLCFLDMRPTQLERTLEFISDELIEKYKDRWISYGRDTRGIFLRSGRPLLKIDVVQQDRHKRDCAEIKFFNDGVLRDFTRRSFDYDIIFLSHLVNTYVNAGIDFSVSSKKLPLNPNVRIAINKY